MQTYYYDDIKFKPDECDDKILKVANITCGGGVVIMEVDFFQANYGFSHRFCTRTKLFSSRTKHFKWVQILYAYKTFCMRTNPLVRGYVHNNIPCVQKGLYPLKMCCTDTKSVHMRTKCFVRVQKVCAHTQGFICVQHVLYEYQIVPSIQNVLYGYKMLCTRPDLGRGGVSSILFHQYHTIVVETLARINYLRT